MHDGLIHERVPDGRESLRVGLRLCDRNGVADPDADAIA
jgi:hypothetical protein